MSKDELDAQVRIGIHSGDITFENEDVFGDGVNLASRLQSITDPGGIYISESLQKSIRSKSDIETKYLGEFNLKNVDYLVRTYAVQGGGLPVPTKEKIIGLSGKSLSQRVFGSTISYIIFLVILVASVWGLRSIFFDNELYKPKILVVLLENYTGSDTIEHIISGIHTSLIAEIGKIGELNIISPYTSRRYKDSGKSLREIASAENVDYILEPTLSCIENDICLNTILIDMNDDENQIWVEDFIEEKSQIVNMYNKITKMVSEKINIVLSPQEEELLAQVRDVDPEVYDLYLRAQKYDGDLSRESLYKSLDYLYSAIEKEPDWAPLYSALAGIWGFINQVGYEPVSVTVPEIYKNLYKALELDPNLSDVHRGLASIAYLVEWDWEKSEQGFVKALAINPNDAIARALYGQLLCNLQRTDEGIAQGRLALELDPLSPAIKVWSGAILLGAGDCKTALALAEEITTANPGDIMGNSLLEAAAFRCKEYDKIMKTWRYILPSVFNFTEEDIKEIEIIFNEQGYLAAYDKVLIHLEEYSENNYVSAISMAESYIMANQPDKTMDWLEKGFEQHDPKMPNITSIFYFEPLFNNPRFLKIVEKMNLPLP